MNPTRKITLTPFQKLEQELRRTAESDTPQLRNRHKVVDKFAKDRKNRKQLTGFGRGVQPGAESTDDDLAPEILIHEDGARSPYEGGDDMPADEALKIVSGTKIGAGYGLDEAELADLDPLDAQ